MYKIKNRKKWGLIRDALGDVWGSYLIILKGFPKKFEKLKIQKLKIYQKWSAFGLQEAPGGFPRARSEKELLEIEPNNGLTDF